MKKIIIAILMLKSGLSYSIDSDTGLDELMKVAIERNIDLVQVNESKLVPFFKLKQAKFNEIYNSNIDLVKFNLMNQTYNFDVTYKDQNQAVLENQNSIIYIKNVGNEGKETILESVEVTEQTIEMNIK